MKNKLFLVLLLAGISAAPLLSSAQGFIGNGTSNGIKAVNSSGTLSGVNVGVGVTTPAAGTTLEVGDPSGSSLGLRFDNLPSTSTPYVLYYDGSAIVTYGPVPSGGVSTVDYDCGIGTVTVNGVTSTNKAWLLSGATTAPTSYFGTFNNDDIRIATNNNACNFNSLKEKMIIGSDANNGNISIGWDGTNVIPNPSSSTSKMIIQNGVVNPTPYAGAFSAYGISPSSIGVYSYANQPSNDINIAYGAVAERTDISLDLGYLAIVQGSTTTNIGSAAFIDGTNINTATNIGYTCDVTGNVSSPSSDIVNKGYQANVTGNNQSDQGNIGYHAYVLGTNSRNTGVWGDAQSPVGVTNANDIDLGVGGVVSTGNYDPRATFFLQGSRIGVYGNVQDMAYGAVNYGVWGDLTYTIVPDNNTNPYYAVYGTAPSGSGSGSGGAASGSNAANCYAGYFEGDVFCSNTYYYSDPKLKQNITPYTGALAQLSQLPVKKYVFKNEEYPHMHLPVGDQIGVLSTDLKTVFPELVKPAMHPADKKGQSVSFEAVNYNALIPVLIQAVKELDAKPADKELAKTVADQQAQIAAQAQQITELRSLLDDLCTNGCAGFNPKGNIQAAPIQGASLYQSIPNPASGTVSIGYSITMPYTTAVISVVTIEGKQLTEYKINTQGNGSVSFDAGNLAAGVYKYYLTIDGRVIDTKSMSIAAK